MSGSDPVQCPACGWTGVYDDLHGTAPASCPSCGADIDQ